jgi:hydrogenase 3 maturation protease
MDSGLTRTLKKELDGWRRVVILGVGNELGGDDGAGIQVIKEVKKILPSDISDVDIFETGVVPENYTGVLRRLQPSHVILIDSAEMGERSGYTAIITAENIRGIIPSSHSLPLSRLTKYIEDEFKAKVIIIGIQPKELSFSTEISIEVSNAVKNLAIILRDSLEKELYHKVPE